MPTRTIKAVNPSACVIGPSIDWEYEDPQAPIDMKTFIPYAAANGMQFTAISWHDNYDEFDQNPLNYSESPEAVRDQAEEVRELIAENPGIGHPKLYVDENSSAAGNFIPGFAASYLAEEDRAGLAESNRTCWSYPGDSSPQRCIRIALVLTWTSCSISMASPTTATGYLPITPR
jgi:hypothetical protein